MGERSRRHHYVQRLVLRGFADHYERVQARDLVTGASYVLPVRKAAAEIDYNTIEHVDGTKSDAAERAMAVLEGAAAPVLSRIAAGGWLESDEEKHAVAAFIALQYIRVPVRREFFDGIADQLLKLQIAAGGPAALRAVLEESGAEPSDDEVMARWRDLRSFDSWSVEMPREHHVLRSLELLEELAPPIAFGYTWCIMRWKRRTLLTSDSPVLLIPGPGHPPWSGVGVATAGSIAFAISRRILLLLVNRGIADRIDGIEVAGTFARAREFNRMTVEHARRRLFAHPEDSLEDLLGDDYEIRPNDGPVLDPDNGADLRESLARMGEWAFRNPDKPHPMTGTPSSTEHDDEL